MTKEELFELTNIDPWWLAQLEELHLTEVCMQATPRRVEDISRVKYICCTSASMTCMYTILQYRVL